jgi:hypothetical protein
MDAIQRFERGGPFLAEKPLVLGRDPETGRVVIVFLSSFHVPGGPSFETPMGVMLTTEAALALLTDLPKLEALLVEATKAPSKPDFVQ